MKRQIVKRQIAKRWIGWGTLTLLTACGGSRPLPHSNVACERPTVIVVAAEGLRSSQGEVRMALFATSEGFPGQPDKALQRGLATIDDSTAVCTFAPVACGNYAVSVFHDEDGDGEMKTDFLGRPQEGWGVSHDARGTFGPPSFDDAVFGAETDTVRIVLHMEY